MGKLPKAVYLGMALMFLSAPLLACSLPGLSMSQEEQECCLHMADQCGSAQMEQSHSCCSKSPTSVAAAVPPAVKHSPASPNLVSDVAPQNALPHVVACPAARANSSQTFSKSPPGHISVLRI
jgi:hypothetical protein